jgi:hypothetical protein
VVIARSSARARERTSNAGVEVTDEARDDARRAARATSSRKRRRRRSIVG